MCGYEIDEICKEEGIEAEVASSDFNSVAGKQADLIVTVKQLAEQLQGYNVAEIRSYTNKKKIKEDVLERIKELVK